MTAVPYLPPASADDEDWFADDPALRRILEKRLPGDVWKALEARLAKLGRVAPRDIDPLARQADANPPVLDATGEVVFDAAYPRLQALARDHEVFTLSWRPLASAKQAPRIATFALGYLYAQAECGYYCPACMTDAAAHVLATRGEPFASTLVPRLVQREAEGAFEGAMYLTEKTGGSDVGATTTSATLAPDQTWRLTGEKWFASNANAEVTLTLARMPDAPSGTRGLGLFILPAHIEGGAPNPGLRRVALKNKLGVRSMATAEVELRDAHAHLVYGAGEGFKAMAEMVNLSRLYNAVASLGIARRALRIGQANGAHRKAFGKSLRDQPLYARAVAALANDVRGALHFVLDTAAAFDAANSGDAGARARMRALTPLAKAMTARLAVDAASQACEFLGGNGYVEEWVTPRLLRDAQVLPIWEGTTNVQALDFLRACVKDGAAEALAADSVRLLPAEDSVLRGAWADWSRDMSQKRDAAQAENAALRLLERAYHLRVATLIQDDAGDGDADAVAHARAYAWRHVMPDDAALDAHMLEAGARLAGWPRI